MRRGFLNKAKAPSAAQSNPNLPPDKQSSSTTPLSEKPGDAMEEDEDATKPTAQEGAKASESFDPHRAPEWLLKQHQKNFRTSGTRFILRHWPRDPKGKPAILDEKTGKQTTNGIPWWGNTLYDFYYYEPYPEIPSYIMASTGSRLAAKMRELGELDAAADEIEWAALEADPLQLVLPNEIARDILPWEDCFGMHWLSSVGREKHARSKEVPLPAPPADAHYDIASIKPENYPSPWPIIPFSCVQPTPKLETLIPYSLLPKKLIVHDPWNVLTMPYEYEVDKETDWTKMPDITHTYELAPSTEAGQRKWENQDKVFRKRVENDDYLIVADDPTILKPFMPLLRVQAPPYPHKTSTPAAHLYLSPASKAGAGNHSEVYHAEWELPRSLLVPDVFCRACVDEEVNVMFANGQLAQMVAEALAAAEKATKAAEGQAAEVTDEGPLATDKEQEATNEAPETDGEASQEHSSSDQNAESLPRAEPCHFGWSDEVVVEPGLKFTVSNKRKEEAGNDENSHVQSHIVKPHTVQRQLNYHGLIVDIPTKVKWQTPGCEKNCKHLVSGRHMSTTYTNPPTAVVRVCAKLSLKNDPHLAREAQVYQALPAHLSEHWSGYNLVRPSREPVPVGAVVPQFYGYYVPTATEEGRYLSPVMLLENCGMPLEPSCLSADQNRECWSLLHRLHHADWLHQSVAPRNVLMQKGPLTTPQGWMRSSSSGLSFRIIDFGRALYAGPPASDGEDDVYRELRAQESNSDVNEKFRRENLQVDEMLGRMPGM